MVILSIYRTKSVLFGGHASGVPNSPCRAGFYTLPTNFLSARCKTAPYIKPIFHLGRAVARSSETFFGSAGTSHQNFSEGTPPSVPIFLIGQECRFSVGQEPNPPIPPNKFGAHFIRHQPLVNASGMKQSIKQVVAWFDGKEFPQR